MARLTEWSWHGLSVTLFVNRKTAKRVFTGSQVSENLKFLSFIWQKVVIQTLPRW